MQLQRPHAQRLQQIAHAPQTDPYGLSQLLRSHGIALRFAHDACYGAAAADVARLDVHRFAGAVMQAVLVSSHLGLTGATSPLPQEVLAALEDVCSSEDGADLAAWVAQVHHRLLELLHRGVTGARPSSCFTTDGSDAMSQQLLRASDHAKDVAPLLRLGAWAALSKPSCDGQDIAWAVGTVLRRYGLGAPVACEPLTGGNKALDAADAWRLGGRNGVVGNTAVLGQVAPALASRIAVVLGPVDGPWLATLEGHGLPVARDVAAMVRATVPLQVLADVAVRLAGDGQQPWRLRAAPTQARGAATWPNPLQGLGVQTFLGAPQAPQTIFWPITRKVAS